MVRQRKRSGTFLRLLTDVQPEVIEEAHVGGDLVLGAAFAGRPNNEPTRSAGAVGLQDSLEPQALFVAGDLSRYAQMLDARHEYDVAARQGDMRGDTGAFLTQRLLGNLDDDLLARL